VGHPCWLSYYRSILHHPHGTELVNNDLTIQSIAPLFENNGAFGSRLDSNGNAEHYWQQQN
jgi:hypothetical protein